MKRSCETRKESEPRSGDDIVSRKLARVPPSPARRYHSVLELCFGLLDARHRAVCGYHSYILVILLYAVGAAAKKAATT